MTADVTATRAYYASLSPASLCDCGYCKNYRQQIRATYPQAAAYLDALGVDIEKPFETSPLEPDPEGFLDYCGGQYIVFGTCQPDERTLLSGLAFRPAPSHPRTGIQAPHFVLEFFPIKLKFTP